MSERVRIHKALADAGVASRRRSEQLVVDGRVTVNGSPAGVGQIVDPATDKLAVDGRPVGSTQRRLYLVMAKPAGVTSTVSDRHAKRTVLDLIPVGMREQGTRLYPIGRLDRESDGLLLLTNDGDWAQRMLHPSHGVEREYAIGLDRPINDDQRRQLEAGIVLDQERAELSHLRSATAADVRRLVDLIGPEAAHLTWYQATLQQGLKRQLRRMFGAVGAPVRRLVRVRFGTLRLADTQLGGVRELTPGERRQLDALVIERRGLIVSLDGPGGSGKSTVGMRAAGELDYRFCDTGVLYRGLTWLALERGVDADDGAALVELVRQVELRADDQERYVRLVAAGRDVTEELHTAAVDREVSRVSRQPDVRAALLVIQRALAAPGRMIMAGRDIGTVVLPDADLKLYLDVSIEERARRRANERGVLDDTAALAQIEHELRQRDGIDSTRKVAPLRIPGGATVVQTEGNTLEQTVDRVVEIIRAAEQGFSGG